jgi:hypothetical protein
MMVTRVKNGLVTENQKQVLKTGLNQKGKKASMEDIRQVKFKVRNKTDDALNGLNFLAKYYPKAIDPELLLKIVKTYLNQELFTISKEEREVKRLPPSLGRKRISKSEKWIRYGDLRTKKGDPTKKRLEQKLRISYKLLKIIHEQLKALTLFKHSNQTDTEPILIINKKGEKLSMDIPVLKYPEMILNDEIEFSELIESRKPEPNSVILWVTK